MIIPDLFGPAVPERRPMDSVGIIDAFDKILHMMVVSSIDENLLHHLRARFRKLVEGEFAIRGLPSPPERLFSVVLRVETPGLYSIHCDPPWAYDIDRLLHNRNCERCGGITTAGFVHSKDECNLTLARDVLDR